jgi:hypothetical protein
MKVLKKMDDNLTPRSAGTLQHTRQITIGEKNVGIVRLDEVIAEVENLGLSDDAALITELMQRIGTYNHIPLSLADDYTKSLLAEYYAARIKLRMERALKNYEQIQKD